MGATGLVKKSKIAAAQSLTKASPIAGITDNALWLESSAESSGSVVLLSSAAAMQGLANHEAIAAAKGGVISLAKSAAATYAGQNLRFNVVAPGLTKTKLTQKITSNEASLKFSQGMHALGRIGEPSEVARAVEFFLDEKSSWITAQVLGVDGGLSNVQPKK
jgi:NAD(P)-dependent dehydrogenase (short-subunit alcohol dehydrogenase family)